MYQRSSYLLGFGWEELTRMDRKAKTTIHAVEGLSKAFVKWLGPGGTLTRKAAENLRDHFKNSIEKQVDVKQFAPLSPPWETYKAENSLLSGKARATGRMQDSITILDQGASQFAVGVPRSTRAYIRQFGMTGNPGKFGKTRITKSMKFFPGYAEIFEKGSSKQPARPVFMHWFDLWLKEKVPTLVSPFEQDIMTYFNTLKDEWQTTGKDFDAMDMAVTGEQDWNPTEQIEGLRDDGFESVIEQEEESRGFYGSFEEQEEAEWQAKIDAEQEIEQANIFKKYERFVEKTAQTLYKYAGPVSQDVMETKDFWRELSQKFQTDVKIWEKISELYMKMADYMRDMGRW